MKPVIAIDPGLTGAVAAYDGHILLVEDVPTYVEQKKKHLNLTSLLSCVRRLAMHSEAYDLLVENVHAMPKQGRTSIFNFGHTVGAIHMLAPACGMALHTVTPPQWKFGVGINATPEEDKRERKAASRAKAAELFPQYAGLFSRAKDDGRAEAALMAWWFVHKRKHP